MSILESIKLYGHAIALEEGEHQLSYFQLIDAVKIRSAKLESLNISTVALALDNSIEWVLYDLAAQQVNITVIPVPRFFTASQVMHLLQTSAVDCVIHDTLNAYLPTEPSGSLCSFGTSIYITKIPASHLGARPKGTQKVTFTSGSTGVPKGVCLSLQNQICVAQSLVDVIAISAPKHLCLLPLSILLENIAGVYAPLLAGGTVTLVPLEKLGFKGSALVFADLLLGTISRIAPSSLILVPELLLVLVNAVKAGWTPPSSLSFIAVGGAKVASELLENAHQLGLPVYQGYGLSECGSVVSLNTPSDSDHATAGKVLPHCQVREILGELVVSGNCHLGYQNDPDSWFNYEFKTGDLVSIKDDFITVNGRKKNLIISSFGRNISPEWPESLLQATGLFYQVVVLGEGKPFCIALVVPLNTQSHTSINNAIKQVNDQLPDYAKIKAFSILEAPMSQQDNLYTSNNRPKRNNIGQYFEQRISDLYINQSHCAESLGSALESI